MAGHLSNQGCYILDLTNERFNGCKAFFEEQNVHDVHVPSHYEMYLRDFSQISNERDMSETSQKHLKRNDFFVTSLRRLKNISKKMSFVWRH